ncbi:MAG: CADD family putative folate metabolism protein [Chthonomonadales bacterium]
MNRALNALDASVARKQLLTHPFYQAWVRGELTRAALQDYATQYYPHVAAFPTYLSALHSSMDDAAARRVILQNLVDEEGTDPTHPELWLRFAEAVGAERSQVLHAQAWPETINLVVNSFRAACATGNPVDGLAALYAYESQIPAVARTKIEGLQRFYAVDTRDGLAYFRVHIKADEQHASAERALLAHLMAGQGIEHCPASVNTVLDALWSLLSAVCTRHGLAALQEA